MRLCLQTTPVFFLSAVVWLIFACLLQQLRALELIFPQFCAQFSFLTFGRVDAAAEVCFLYGWGSCAVFGLGFRYLEISILRLESLLAFFWNLAVAIGVGTILGEGNMLAPAFPPGLAFFLLLLALLLCVPVLLGCLRSPTTIASHWLLASFLSFPWLLMTSGFLLQEGKLRGAARLPVAAWFHEGMLWLWLGGCALAFAYFLLSKVLHTPIVEQRLTLIGFWMYFSVGSIASLRILVGGPVPAWVSAAGASANLLLWVPLVVIWRNLCGTFSRFSLSLESGPALCFTAFGASAFVLSFLQSIVLYSRSGASYFQFTDFASAQSVLVRYGFLTSIFCAAFYYFVPRMLLCNWPRPRAIFWHFHFHRIGLAMMVISLAIGGTLQGILLNTPGLPFSASHTVALPWRCVAALGWSLFLTAQIIFMFHFIRLFGMRKGEER